MPATIESPGIAGVTQASRAAREAEMQPLSKENASIMPTMVDIGRLLGVRKPAPQAPAAEVKPEETPEEEAPEAPEESVAEDPLPEEAPDESSALDEAPEEPEQEQEEQPKQETPKEPVQKRIDQLTAQKGELQRQLEEARAQLAKAQLPRDERDPLAHIATVQELDVELSKARDARAFAMKNRYGTTVKGENGAEQVLSEEQMTDIYLNAEAVIESAAARREQLAGMAADEDALLKVAPHLAQTEHPHTAYVDQILAYQGAEIRRMAASAKMSPRRVAYALALGLNQLSQQHTAPSASPATRPAQQQPRKAPPIPAPRTAPRAPAETLRKRDGDAKSKHEIARGNRSALERVAMGFLK